MKNKKAFTILELLVVVAIIAILAIIAIIAIPQFIGKIALAKDSRILAEVASVTKALAMFKMDNGYYPIEEDDQPILGDPKIIKFVSNDGSSSLYPKYIDRVPQAGLWYVDYAGQGYNSDYAILEPSEDPTERVLNHNLQAETFQEGLPYVVPYYKNEEGRKVVLPAIGEVEIPEGTDDDDTDVTLQTPNNTNIKTIALGSGVSSILYTNGDLYMAGNLSYTTVTGEPTLELEDVRFIRLVHSEWLIGHYKY